MELTQARLKELLHYDPETGHFTWMKSGRPDMVGRQAGHQRPDRYVFISVDGRPYPAHWLVWLYMTGALPSGNLDHINVDPGDNRWANLRKATRTQNLCNTKRRSDNTSGYKGVCWCRQKQRWMARIYFKGKAKHLGFFKTPELAHAAYCAAAADVHGEFARVA